MSENDGKLPLPDLERHGAMEQSLDVGVFTRKAESETLLRDELSRRLDGLDGGHRVMLKLTLPETPDLYRDLARHPRVAKMLALSGGYPRAVACRRLANNHDMVASFSRALIEDLLWSMTDDVFDRTLGRSIDEIFQASTVKAA